MIEEWNANQLQAKIFVFVFSVYQSVIKSTLASCMLPVFTILYRDLLYKTFKHFLIKDFGFFDPRMSRHSFMDQLRELQ